MSAIILAGGGSNRMGTEKAFLQYQGRAFISVLTAEMAKISDDVVVMVGDKDETIFREYVSDDVRVLKDRIYVSNPLGGIASGLDAVEHESAAVLGCDTPLLRAEVISFLADQLVGFAAAVPAWGGGGPTNAEPLCSAYSVAEAKSAALLALGSDRRSAKQMLTFIRDVRYVDVSQIRLVDPALESFTDVNTPEEYRALKRRDEVLAHVTDPVRGRV